MLVFLVLDREILKFLNVPAGRVSVVALEESAEILRGGKLKPLCCLADRKTLAEQENRFLEEKLLCILLWGDVVFISEELREIGIRIIKFA